MALTKIITDGITDDAVTSGKIPANAVGTSEIADDAVTAAKIADGAIDNSAKIGGNIINNTHMADNAINTAEITDQAVTLAKLPHGTSSNDGKFLRANNGADPSFESLPTSGATLSGSTDNTIVTVTGSNAMQGEANFTFDGTKAGITGNLNVGGQLTQTSHSASINKSDGNCIQIGNTSGTGAGSHDAQIVASDGTNFNNLKLGGHETKVFANVSGGTGYAETWRFDSSGNLACKLAGKGIDFSAASGSASGSTSALLDDYEEGTYTPTITNGFDSGLTYSEQYGFYRKIGTFVEFNFFILIANESNDTDGTHMKVGLPFTSDTTNGKRGHGTITYTNFTSMYPDNHFPLLYVYSSKALCYASGGTNFSCGNGANQANRYFIGGGVYHSAS